MNPYSRPQQKSFGFTLIELLIAMVIFAILATMAYGGLSSIIRSSERVQGQIVRLESLQRTIMFLERDIRQLAARPMNTDVAVIKGAVEMLSSGSVLIEFSRGGNPNPAGLLRSSLQRVAYVLEESTLYRLAWDSVDHLETEEPIRLKLLDQVDSVEFKLLDPGGRWQTKWEPEDELSQLPLAVDFTIDHKYWGEIRRLLPIYGF